MEVVILVVALLVLILVHEFGHFVAAKLSGMRVDEFGIGFPPRALTLGKIGETEYTLNWLPLGGFVKIYGEDSDAAAAQAADSRAFSARPRILQAAVLVAGIAMNFVLAYALITGALVAGTPRALSDAEIPRATQVQLAVSNVLPNSPAQAAGVEPGDSILSAADGGGKWQAADPDSFSAFIAASGGQAVSLSVSRGGKTLALTATPAAGLIGSDPSRYAIGVEVATIGVVPLSPGAALTQGAQITWGATALTAAGLAHFFASVFTLHADLSQVAGPVGIAGAVGAAASQGFGDLLSLVAIISINLALINLIPIPALDGGRLLFVIIEGVIRRPIPARVARSVNGLGYAFLLLLMAVVTAHDIFRIVS